MVQNISVINLTKNNNRKNSTNAMNLTKNNNRKNSTNAMNLTKNNRNININKEVALAVTEVINSMLDGITYDMLTTRVGRYLFKKAHKESDSCDQRFQSADWLLYYLYARRHNVELSMPDLKLHALGLVSKPAHYPLFHNSHIEFNPIGLRGFC